VVLVAAILAVELIYVFVVSVGTFGDWPEYGQYYNFLAEGLRAGHLHLSLEPNAELLSKADPYAADNFRIWLWDASFYHGHYYIYWGPVPALLLAAVKILARTRAEIGDQYLVFAFLSVRLVAGTLLLDRLARRLVPRLPLALLALAVLVFGLATPTPFLLARANVYEAAITGGQAFVLLGLVFALGAVLPAAEESRRGRLVLVGACWALALGCRVSLGPAVALLVVATAWASARLAPSEGAFRTRLAVRLVLLSAPMAAAVLLLLVYNRARFDAWLEFGTNVQVSTAQFHTSRKFFAANVYSYLLRPLVPTCKFPFLTAPFTPDAPDAFPSWLQRPPGYELESLAGVLVSVPWSWLGVVTLVAAASRIRARARWGFWDARDSVFIWTVAISATLATVTLTPVLTLYTSTMRYLGDASAGYLVFVTLGAWSAWAAVRSRPALRRLVVAALFALAAASIVVGVLPAFEGYDHHFKHFNPRLYARLVDSYSLCR
jgi:hypothetical protein